MYLDCLRGKLEIRDIHVNSVIKKSMLGYACNAYFFFIFFCVLSEYDINSKFKR